MRLSVYSDPFCGTFSRILAYIVGSSGCVAIQQSKDTLDFLKILLNPLHDDFEA
jgi:hypothetical protein